MSTATDVLARIIWLIFFTSCTTYLAWQGTNNWYLVLLTLFFAAAIARIENYTYFSYSSKRKV